MKLRTTVFLWVLALVAAILGATLAVAAVILDRGARRQVAANLAEARAGTLRVHALEQKLASSQCRVVAEEPRMKAVTATEDVSHETVIDVAETLAATLGGSLFVITDAEGTLLADVMDPDASGFAMGENAVVKQALERGESVGVWLDERGPHRVQGCRLQFGEKVVGALVIGHALDAATAEEIAAQTGGPVAVALAGKAVGASPFHGAAAPADDLARAAAKVTGAAQVEVTVGGTRYYVAAAPVPAYTGGDNLRYLVFRSLDEALAPRRRLVRVLGIVVAVGLLGTLALGTGLARKLAGPIVRLVDHTRAIAAGDMTARVPDGPTEVRALGDAMNRMAGELETSRKQLADRERMARELEIATRIQTSILPRRLEVAGLEIAARMQPADEVGGDYYDVLPTPGGHAWIAIGDVAGHGLNAGVIMMMVQTAVATLVRSQPDAPPSELLRALNDVIYENVRRRLESDKHVTLSLLRWHGDGTLTLAGAHLDMTLWRARTRTHEAVETTGTWISVVEDIRRATRDERLTLEPGDVLCLCTDGVTEAMNDANEQFGFERVYGELSRLADQPVEAMAEAILERARAFARVQLDDMTVMVLRYRGPEAA